MADIKWIKIVTDIFDDDKILLIETLPEADSIIVIWFKLLCLAGKQNNSGVFVMGNGIPYTDKMLAAIFRRKEAIVKLALQTFEQFGMVQIIENTITIPNWGKHQNLDKFDEFYSDGQGILLYGAVGTGKSYYAACIVNRVIDNEYSAHMTNFSRIINTMQNVYDGKQKYLDDFNSFKLLVLDDLGIERETSFMNEQVYNIIDNRYRSNLPMIITTNLAYSDIVNCEDIDKRRIYDRILEVCHPVEVKGESRRLIAVKEKTQRINNLLGL